MLLLCRPSIIPFVMMHYNHQFSSLSALPDLKYLEVRNCVFYIFIFSELNAVCLWQVLNKPMLNKWMKKSGRRRERDGQHSGAEDAAVRQGPVKLGTQETIITCLPRHPHRICRDRCAYRAQQGFYFPHQATVCSYSHLNWVCHMPEEGAADTGLALHRWGSA